MRTRLLAISLVIATAALMIGVVACSSKTKTTTSSTPTSSTPTTSSGNAQSEVAVTLVEYKVVPNVTSVPAGTVTFNAKNIGGAEHELHVIKTELAPEALPTNADGSVDEEAAGLTMVDHANNIAAGSEKSLTVNLAPGKYVLVCNVVQENANGSTTSHYKEGMHVAFTITE